MASRIEDYALIGDCQTAALVARDGSIDWLCLPRFDSSACFAALLGTPEHGRWLIAPASEVRRTVRRYRGDTLVLETEHQTAEGIVALIDFMPLRSGQADVVRIVEGRAGRVPMRMDLVIRFDYGVVIPWVRHIERGIRAVAGPDTLYLRTPVNTRGEGLHTVAEFTVAEGERVPFDLTWSPTYGARPPGKYAEEALRQTEQWWSEWIGRCTYRGGWRDAVLRSLITLRALTYSPTGAIVAAPTTSLPEHIGGVRNWDYRFCWVRDAAYTLYALTIGGYTEEALAWRQWLINAAAGAPAQMQIMYGVAGERRLTELEVEWLPGYENSAPVRIGNDAYRQHQLDIYGALMDALHLARRAGVPPDDNAWRVQCELVRFLEDEWRNPDKGIWEVRGPRRHFVHSKVMAWVAFDRAVKAVERFGAEGEVEKWRALREEIRSEVLERGFDPVLNSFVQFYGGKQLDASLLMLPLVGFLSARDPRMRGTVDAIQRQLTDDGLLKRYRTEPEMDGLPPGDGDFLLCSFWLADNLALQGRHDEACAMFERLLALRNDVGLLSEEYDPRRHRMLGNFPQAFSHVSLINTACNLSGPGGPAEDEEQQSPEGG